VSSDRPSDLRTGEASSPRSACTRTGSVTPCHDGVPSDLR
jgi:hypothetical protein